MSARPAYFDRYKTICFDRTASGILTIRLHSNDGPVVYGSAHHNDWVHAFFDISADRDNKVLIITGTGDEFIATERWDKPYDKVEHWDQIYWEGKRVLQNLLDIEIPVIGAINGPAHVHAEIGILADITIAADHASFQDLPHVPGGTVPVDGVHVIWLELLGLNRGRYFLLSGQILSAQEALALGVVNEVVPRERLLERAGAHPFLEAFSRHRARNALATQMHFLIERVRQLDAVRQADMFQPARVADFLIEKDRLFARLNLDANEYALYETIYERLVSSTLRPDLVIYLQAPVDVLIDRVRQRGIAFEQLLERKYLEQLNEAYSQFFHFYDDAPLLIVNAAAIDFANDENHYTELVDYLLNVRSGRQYFNPTFF